MKKTNIVLTGFMGTGKTTIGSLVAKSLNKVFVDTDLFIETVEEMSIRDIFLNQNKGPDYFREEEDRVCDELCVKKDQVISFGGGTIVNNYQKFANNSLIVCLYAPFEHIYARIKNSKKRPLVSDERKLRHLFNERQEFYNKSDLMINVESFSAKKAADLIVQTYFLL